MTRDLPPDLPPSDPPDDASGEDGPRRRLAGVVALALVGLLLAAGVTYAASRLVSQPIGLPAEPGALGTELAPATATVGTTSTSPRTMTTEVRTVTVTTIVPPAEPEHQGTGPDDSSGGDDYGGDGGHGSDGWDD